MVDKLRGVSDRQGEAADYVELAALLLFAVPGLGLLALPCGVAGAVRLVVVRYDIRRRS
jgi:hypothetical protein